MKKIIILGAVLLLSSCASSTAIERVSGSKSEFDGAVYGGQLNVVNEDNSGSERYRVFHHAASGFVSVQAIRESAEKRANEFCYRKGKVFKTLSEQTSQPPHILGNFPRIEIIFVCVGKPILATPSNLEDTRYIKLTNLKKLLDDNVITKVEFDQEKAKILK